MIALSLFSFLFRALGFQSISQDSLPLTHCLFRILDFEEADCLAVFVEVETANDIEGKGCSYCLAVDNLTSVKIYPTRIYIYMYIYMEVYLSNF